MSSLAGEMSGLTKEQFLAICKAKYPDEVDFVKAMEALAGHAEMQIEQAQAKLEPGQTLAVAYVVETRNTPVH